MTAGQSRRLVDTFVWRIVPPVVDFVGAIDLFFTVDWRMAVALVVFVQSWSAGCLPVRRPRPALHRAYAAAPATVGGELVDVIANMWAVKAFSARGRERNRLPSGSTAEAGGPAPQLDVHGEGRVSTTSPVGDGGRHALLGVYLERGPITPGDVVIVSALTFRILHGSRDLALGAGRRRRSSSASSGRPCG